MIFCKDYFLVYWSMTQANRTSSTKDFLDKLFDLCREYQQEIPPHKIAEVLREYADRLDWREDAPMHFFFSSNRSKLLLAIGLIAIGIGLSAKHVIPYPAECFDGVPIEVKD